MTSPPFPRATPLSWSHHLLPARSQRREINLTAGQRETALKRADRMSPAGAEVFGPEFQVRANIAAYPHTVGYAATMLYFRLRLEIASVKHDAKVHVLSSSLPWEAAR